MTNTTEELTPDETTVPLLPCVSVEETLAFYRALGFTTTYEQTRPYVYLALSYSGFQLHFTKAPAHVDPDREDGGGCLVMVDEVAPYHAAFTRAMRGAHGKVLTTGRPRITRFRPGASRFTLVDPSGNSIMFIRRDEPAELEYGGSKELKGLARALDNARILVEFKNDDHLALKVLTVALRRHGERATPLDLGRALAWLIELGTVLGERDAVDAWRARLAAVPLDAGQRRSIEDELRDPDDLGLWPSPPERGDAPGVS
ncbi:glyoxalase [Streptomyces antimicrobicus]|uniref:Glyoxalase n=1 Tax=Streptomyces antimicrobicus TaxID=2883108 RepID=A0ABS8B2F0_9ACTN|nr:glyoxalase [Streptomyces antimicrobicus]MCB5178777.1 glyoxalase [Streptomyces antimicrobicus]